MNWDTEIWAPCRLGEAFTLREFKSERTEYLYSIKADWMGHRGDAACVFNPSQLEKEYSQPIRVGAGPRPWANCWTYEPKIKITPPVWCWDMQDDTLFGLDLKPKRNGNRRKVKLSCVMIHKGRPVYRIVVEMSDGNQFQYLDSIPVLDPYFAPIWPVLAEETPVAEEPAPEPVAAPVAETATNAPEAEQTAPERNEPPEKRNAYALGGIIHTPGMELQTDPGELIVPTDQLRRVLTTAFMAQTDEDAPATWTDTENRSPRNAWYYYYYTWHDERNEKPKEWEDINTVFTEESELVEGDALYLRFAGCSKQIRHFEAYTGPHDFVSRIARFVDGTGMSLEKGHYYRKLI